MSLFVWGPVEKKPLLFEKEGPSLPVYAPADTGSFQVKPIGYMCHLKEELCGCFTTNLFLDNTRYLMITVQQLMQRKNALLTNKQLNSRTVD